MKLRLVLILAALFAAARAEAQSPPFLRNDSGATINSEDLHTGSAAVDLKGNLIAGTGAANFGKAEDAAAGSGDTIIPMACRSNTSGTSVTIGADGRYGVPACTTTGALQSVVLGQALGVSLGRLEDDTWTSADVMAVVGGVSATNLALFQSSTSETAHLVQDRLGRLMVSSGNYNESFDSCGTATATTADVAMKAAVASNRMYVTSIDCKSTSATTATSLDFKDGTTVKAVGGIAQMATTSPGSFNVVFPTPLRGTVNTALNFATNVSTSSVTCCAHGYIAVD